MEKYEDAKQLFEVIRENPEIVKGIQLTKVGVPGGHYYNKIWQQHPAGITIDSPSFWYNYVNFVAKHGFVCACVWAKTYQSNLESILIKIMSREKFVITSNPMETFTRSDQQELLNSYNRHRNYPNINGSTVALDWWGYACEDAFVGPLLIIPEDKKGYWQTHGK